MEDSKAELKTLVERLNTIKGALSSHQIQSYVSEHPHWIDLFRSPSIIADATLRALDQFEIQFEVKLTEDLKEALSWVGLKGFEFGELFRLDVSRYYPIEAFMSPMLVEVFAEAGITPDRIEEAIFDCETRSFEHEDLQILYKGLPKDKDWLVYYVPHNECCGGRQLFLINGPDANTIAYDNHWSHDTIEYKGKAYTYQTYLESQNTSTLLERMVFELKTFLDALESHVNTNTLTTL